MTTPSVVRFTALAAICLLATQLPSNAQTSITVPDFSFSTDNSSSSYANQYPVDYSPYPDAEIFSGWVSSSYDYQIYQTSTSASSGTFNGSTAVEVSNPQTAVTESLNPVVAHIANNAVYTLTFSLSASDYQYYTYDPDTNSYIGPFTSATPNSGDVTLELLSTTSGSDPTNYAAIPPYYDDPNTGLPYGPNPTPIITTTATLATTTISGSTIDAQGAGVYQDYSLTFSTLDGMNSSAVGQDMSIALSIAYGNNTDFDNVRLTEVEAPEPGTWALMGLGLLSLVALGRFRQLTA
jgi:hypothetical protein